MEGEEGIAQPQGRKLEVQHGGGFACDAAHNVFSRPRPKIAIARLTRAESISSRMARSVPFLSVQSQGGNMATINRTQGTGNQNFKQIEGDGWLSTYLPAICAGTVMAVVLLLAISCSNKSSRPAAKISASTTAATNAVANTAPAVTPEAPKKVKKHRPANATYVNGVYGVSFSYPRKYSLQTGNKKSDSASASSMPVPANFLKPGAIEIASVDMPDDSYPETDFSSALLNVSVNSGMTAAECPQFVPNGKESEAAKAVTVKLGANEFSELEQMNGETDRQSDLKYFHVFKNGACYEFALDVETSAKPDTDFAQVVRGKIFQQLEKILTTARIKDIELPGIENAEKPASTQMPATSSAQVVAPEQK